MGGRIRILLCLAVGALALLTAGSALAQGGGTTTSAGDQQYVDPLSQSTSATPAPKTSAPATTTPAPSTTTPTTSGSSSPPSSTTVATTPSAGSSTLPYTGLNLGLVIAVGLGLLGGGLVLLRLARRAGPGA